MSNSTIMGVCGPIAPEDLGFTLMHEHILVMNWSMRQSFTKWLDRPSFVEKAVKALKQAKELGVKSIVDLTPINLGRDIQLIHEVAEKAEINVIAATGFYWTEEPSLEFWDVDALVDLLLPDLETGIAGTSCKAGIIKCATDRYGVNEFNEKLLITAAKLQKASGKPISTHTDAHKEQGLLQQDVFEAEGVPLDRVVIGHCGDSEDLVYLEKILNRGSYIGMDRFGAELLLSTDKRISTISKLCEKGWAHKMVLSHDASCKMDWWPNFDLVGQMMPNWNYRHIPQNVIPALKEEGVSDEDIHQMTVLNPLKIFTS